MKSYTDINQSKKLAEILPLESADMGLYYSHNTLAANNQMWVGTKSKNADIPCWSLVALLKLMPFQIIKNNNRFGFYQVKGFNKQGETYRFGYKTNNDSFLFETSWYNDVIDAAFEMIIKLNEQKLL